MAKIIGMDSETFFQLENTEDCTLVRLSGEWRIDRLDEIEASYRALLPRIRKSKRVVFDLSGVRSVDTGGMIFFIAIREELGKTLPLEVRRVPREFCRMYRLVKRYSRPVPKAETRAFVLFSDFLNRVGASAVTVVMDFIRFLNFLGETSAAIFRSILHPSSIRFKETSSNIYKAGVTALPIVALSSFLVGIVVAYQSAVQLEKYGANIFIVDMIGISIPRELAPLITAIIVAGRSGSAYTAQIGVMKITEEIDAMKTMGFEIFRFVVLPRIFAMIVALPLLIFFADIISIYAGMIIAKSQLGINSVQFLDRLQNAVDVKHYIVGIFKAPFFAFIIAAIGCFRGFEVSGTTESIGRYTTMSVVNAIFLVVAVDALFSVIFTELGI
ncbi:ABC transporter permease [Hydrogenimonas urashimensis]|uniref:ABC transporter permease n=1 Tax=Hydrogenimonas urashimensis TaxID=2740515 RepID=UPI001F490815|nr:MlaE family lipid ABC transporter permease subunit [Hydrogenimonas urashimensis]